MMQQCSEHQYYFHAISFIKSKSMWHSEVVIDEIF